MKQGRERGLRRRGGQIHFGETPGSSPRAGTGGAAAPGGGSSDRARAAVRGRCRRGCPRGTGGLRGHPRYSAALAPPSCPPGLRGRAPGLRRRADGLPLLQPSRGGVPTLSGCAGLSGACSFPQLLHGWEFPAALAPRPSRNTCSSRGCKQRFSLLAVTAGSCESPALSVASFRCSWIVHLPSPLHPDGALRGDTGSQRGQRLGHPSA